MLTKRENDRLKLLGGQFILFITLLVSLLNILGTYYIILRLTKIHEVVNVLPDEKNGDELVFNQDLIIDKILLHDGLRTQKIQSNQITVSGSSGSKGRQAKLSLDPNSVSFEAKSFTLGEVGENLTFRLAKRLNALEVSHGIKNLRVLRAPSLKKNESSDSDNNLEVLSTGKLDLSGNMGLRAHSHKMYIKSPDLIDIESREESIILMARRGLILRSISLANDMTSNEEMSNMIIGNVKEQFRHQACISRDDGSFYQALNDCE